MEWSGIKSKTIFKKGETIFKLTDMKAIELRIKNYVWDDYSGKMIVSGISQPNGLKETLNLKKHNGLPEGSYLCEGIQPIPLTEEWLLKFHSNKDEIEKSKRFPNKITIYDRFLFIWKEEYKYWYVITSNHKEYLTKIEFVHEYQNFIFALTGEELILK